MMRESKKAAILNNRLAKAIMAGEYSAAKFLEFAGFTYSFTFFKGFYFLERW